MIDEWKTISRPGFFGRQRDTIINQYNEQYGKDNWRIVWKVGNKTYIFNEAIMLYEDAYYEYLKENNIVTEDITRYDECYDSDITNIRSGLYYHKQENNSNHYQDVAIRRVLKRLGLWFTEELGKCLHIRSNSKDALGKMLSPGRVSFHRQDLVEQPRKEGWWEPNSIEDFWQSNKILQVRKEALR